MLIMWMKNNLKTKNFQGEYSLEEEKEEKKRKKKNP